MKPRLKPQYLAAEQGGQRDRWLVSYTDLISILLILFAAVAAQGLHLAQTLQPHQPARQKIAAIPKAQVESPQPQVESSKSQVESSRPPVESPKPRDPALFDAQEKLRAQGLDTHLEKRGLVISLPQAVLFPSGEDRVIPGALPMVSQIAQVLASVPNKVALVGHADSVPIHNKHFQNNWELSAARSVKLLELLTTRYGLTESRFSVQSSGSYDPKDSNETPSGRAENRRVEILLLDESAQ